MAVRVVNSFLVLIRRVPCDKQFGRDGFMVIFAVEIYLRRTGFKRVEIANVRCAVDAKTLLRRLRRADRRPRSRHDLTVLSRYIRGLNDSYAVVAAAASHVRNGGRTVVLK